MKDFLYWLNSIGYSNEEINTLSKSHIKILQDEYTMLMEEYSK